MKTIALMLIIMLTLVGCDYHNYYTLYDSRGCAFTVARAPGSNVPADEWNNHGGSNYQATIQRATSEDKPTCPLPING